MKRHTFLIWGLVLLVVGLVGLVVTDVFRVYYEERYESSRERAFERTYGDRLREPFFGPGMMGTGNFMMRDFSKSSYSSNGEEIYLTGRSGTGGRIFSNFGMMRIGCANCHGADGTGGLKFPDGTVSADVRWKTLAKAGFTETIVKRAITEGLDEKGSPLGRYMPRWTIDASDLDDLILFMKTL